MPLNVKNVMAHFQLNVNCVSKDMNKILKKIVSNLKIITQLTVDLMLLSLKANVNAYKNL